MCIQRAVREDLPEILALQYLAYRSEAELCGNPTIPPLTQTLAQAQAEFDRGVFLKALAEDGKIIASVRAYSEDGTLHVGKLFVHPDWQGRGIGSALLREIERRCPHTRYELFTSTKSERNIGLYERLGYVRFREREQGGGLQFVYLQKCVE